MNVAEDFLPSASRAALCKTTAAKRGLRSGSLAYGICSDKTVSGEDNAQALIRFLHSFSVHTICLRNDGQAGALRVLDYIFTVVRSRATAVDRRVRLFSHVLTNKLWEPIPFSR